MKFIYRLGGMLVELTEGPHKWAFISISLGDCKVFHWSSTTLEINDITANNRSNITDPKGKNFGVSEF